VENEDISTDELSEYDDDDDDDNVVEDADMEDLIELRKGIIDGDDSKDREGWNTCSQDEEEIIEEWHQRLQKPIQFLIRL
jgi:hypothetical protein